MSAFAQILTLVLVFFSSLFHFLTCICDRDIVSPLNRLSLVFLRQILSIFVFATFHSRTWNSVIVPVVSVSSYLYFAPSAFLHYHRNVLPNMAPRDKRCLCTCSGGR